MRKQTVAKDDGRLITYYWFDRREGVKGSRDRGIQGAGEPLAERSCLEPLTPVRRGGLDPSRK